MLQQQKGFILQMFADLGLLLNNDKCDFVCDNSTTLVGFTVYSIGEKGPWVLGTKKEDTDLTETFVECSSRLFGQCVGAGSSC